MQLRASLIGCGAMSRAWLEAAQKIEGLAIVGLADLDATKAESRAAEFGLRDIVLATDVETLLARAKPDILFDIVVPTARHAIVSAGLDAGCHVLSEKPMAETLDEARDLVARARAAGRLHAVVQNRRYLESVRRIARALSSGAIGEITSVHADFFLAPHFGGFREEMDHVLLLDMAIHSFDAMRCMTGLAAEGVYCREWDPPRLLVSPGFGGCRAVRSGQWGGVHLSRQLVRRGPRHELGMRMALRRRERLAPLGRTRRHQDRGRAAARAAVSFEASSLAVPPLAPADRIGGHLGVMQDFVAAVRGGTEPETVGRDNIRSLAMALGAIDSAGRPGGASKSPFETGEQDESIEGHSHRHDGPRQSGQSRRLCARTRQARLREHRAVLLADDGQGPAKTGARHQGGDRRRRCHDRHARHVRQPARGGDLDRRTLAGWEALIDHAHLFGAKTIAGFTGRVRGKPIEASLPRYKAVWGALARRAADKGVRSPSRTARWTAIGRAGDWNIAHNPDAWELMFNALPDENLGLEWEPCHQLVYLIDPIPQIRKWAPKFFHVHGKDATVRWDVIREHGVFGKVPFVQMRSPASATATGRA
jgi:predicted dehydrogenase